MSEYAESLTALNNTNATMDTSAHGNTQTVDSSVTTSADYYFDSYSHFGIHEEMIKDQVRTGAYLKAIEKNAHMFKDKIVLDVGCGTGILSMFCAQHGAKQVFAVDCSNIAIQCKQIIQDNNFSDVIQVFHGKMEDIQLPVQHVDIIVSEWMGYFLLYESMLGTVLFARDKYLRPETGLILPDRAVLYLCGIEDAQYKKEKIDFWDNVYGFNMKCIKDIALMEPLIDNVDPQQIITTVCPVLTLDIMTCKLEDLDFTSEFKLSFTHSENCHAIVGYFECAFTKLDQAIAFSTSPYHRVTHWKQTVFYLAESVRGDANEDLNGRITVKANEKNPRDLDIIMQTKFQGKSMSCEHEKLYRLR